MTSGTVRPVNIDDEMRSAYLDYAMSVIVSRALPDVRDGLKPVQRRILYAMNDMGLDFAGPHRKAARIVGEVLGKYHPHGDSSVYEAMVRMAQDFSLRYPLIDGQGNFGSVDNDPPAAMRYTEARLARIADEVLVDLDKDTVDFMPNFDDSLKEPTVLPTRIPNLLLNGSAGIAVGMATNVPPHNLVEVCDAIAHLIDNPDASIDELTQFVKGPDFPTAGIIRGVEGIRDAYATGHGKIVLRAKAQIGLSTAGRRQIVVTELPYQTNKAAMVENIADLVRSKKIEGIAELRDESDRQGMRVVIEVKKEAQPEHVLRSLYKHTAMQSSFFINMLALVDGQPRVLSLKEALQYFITFRQEVITRRSRFELKEAKARAHILEGLRIALDNLDRVIAIIRKAENAEAARKDLMANFNLSQAQAQAILDMQLRRLASLERKKILDEYQEVLKTINYLEELLASPRRIMALISQETADVKARYGDSRRTAITEKDADDFKSVEDEIPHERVVVTLSDRSFIKRVPSTLYTPKHRGAKGKMGMMTREADAVRLLAVTDTHDNLFFFTNRGKAFVLKAYEVPVAASRGAKGTAVINLFSVAERERVTALVPVTAFAADSYMIMATSRGEVKKTSLANFAAVRSNGLIAYDLEEHDELVAVALANDLDKVMIITRLGQAIKFPVSQLRSSSRTSGGVRGIRLDPGDTVVSMDRADENGYILVVSEGGLGKLTAVSQYRLTHRGGSGVKTYNAAKAGPVAAAKMVTLADEVMVISAEGMVTSTPVREKDPKQGGISIKSRNTQGVKVMTLEPGDKVVAVAAYQ